MWQLFIFILHLCILELPTKHPREKFLDPQSTHEKKFWTHEIPTRKNFGPTTYLREKILDPRNTYEKKFWTHGIPTRKNFGPTHEIPMRKYFESTNARWHSGTRPTEFGTLNFFLIVHVLKKFD